MTRYDIGSCYDDRNVYTKLTYDGALIGVENTFRSREEFAYLTPEQAYKLADWITANVERPRPKSNAEEAFAQIAIGERFGFYYEDETPSRYPYTKVSDTTYRGVELYAAEKTLEPSDKLIPVPQPKTAWDHWTELPVGTVFTVTSGTGTYVKDGDVIKWARDETPAREMKIWSSEPYDLIREIYRPAS